MINPVPINKRNDTPIACDLCPAPATRWYPDGDDGCGMVTCETHGALCTVGWLPLPPGTTQSDYRRLQSEVCYARDGQPVPHQWTGKRMSIPGEPDEYIEVCAVCGCENPGTCVE